MYIGNEVLSCLDILEQYHPRTIYFSRRYVALHCHWPDYLARALKKYLVLRCTLDIALFSSPFSLQLFLFYL